MPFCQVSRLTTQKRMPSPRSRPKRCSMRALVRGAELQACSAVAGDEMRIGRRVPDVGVDAVDDAGEHVAAGAQQPVEPHAAGAVVISSA